MPRASSAVSATATAPVASGRGANARPAARKRSIADARKGIDTGTYEGAEQLDPNKPLTERQLTFVKFWAEGHTVLMASAKAGYNDGGSFAYRMVRMPHILRRYQEEKIKYEQAAEMSRKRVMNMLLDAYDTAKLVAEPGSMVAAAREIGKMCGYYEPVTIRHEHNVQGDIVHRRIEGMKDEELIEFIAQQQQQIAQSPEGATTTSILHPEHDVEDAKLVGDAA